MKRLSLFFLFAILVALVPTLVVAQEQQKILNVEEDTEGGIGIYPCGDRHEAMVQFVTSEQFDLEFRSNYDPDMKVEVDSVAGTKTYSIVFVTQAPGVSFDGRRLTVMAPGFRNHVMTLNLRDKQKFIYQVSDPYSALRSPYFIYLEQANDQFYNGQYQAAKDSYQMVRVCPEYKQNSQHIDERIEICDSMIVWNAEALKLEQFAQFPNARDLYYKMYYYNSGNKDISGKIAYCQAAYLEDCENEYLLAEHYMSSNQLELAEASYQRVVDKKCSAHMAEALSSLSNLKKHQTKVTEHARCFFLEYAPNMPLGFTYAQCYSTSRRSSGYISMHFNASDVKGVMGRVSANGSINGNWPKFSYSSLELREAFENGDLSWDYKEKFTENSEGNMQPKDFVYEASISFGWTFRAWKYLFLHLGGGYHGGGFNTFDDDNAIKGIARWVNDHPAFNPATQPFDKWKSELRHNCMKVNYFSGIAPEYGLIVKAGAFNVKATYQNTIWLNRNGYEDFLDDHSGKFYMGVGFNW